MNLYFDTSALVKFFHVENGTDVVSRLLENKNNKIYVSELVKIEFLSALYRRFRNNEIKEKKLEQAITGFDKQLNNFYIEPLSHTVVNEAEFLIRRYGEIQGLRTLDSLQLATFNLISNPDWSFVSTDEKLCSLAREIGYNIINPLKS